jgi:hypothetical protein
MRRKMPIPVTTIASTTTNAMKISPALSTRPTLPVDRSGDPVDGVRRLKWCGSGESACTPEDVAALL